MRRAYAAGPGPKRREIPERRWARYLKFGCSRTPLTPTLSPKGERESERPKAFALSVYEDRFPSAMPTCGSHRLCASGSRVVT